MIGLTGTNFLAFISIEIYCVLNEGLGTSEKERRLEEVSFSLLSYFHLYYQFNIYLGVFCLFSVAMAVVYMIN